VADPAAWQRWTIDEIDSGTCRIIVAHALQPFESSVAEAFDTGADVDELRQRVLDVEDLSADGVWQDEEAAFLPVETLYEFLRRRARIRGLPDPRLLREGDVFWIVLPPDVDEDELAQISPASVLALADELDVQVWDVTAAARQAAKRTYQAALRAGAPEPAVPLGGNIGSDAPDAGTPPQAEA